MQVLLDITVEEFTALQMLRDDNYCSKADIESLVKKVSEAIESEKDETINTAFYWPTIKNVTIGRQVIFDPHVGLSLMDKGAYIRFPHSEAVAHCFGIGKDHVGYLVMTRQAWEALNSPEPVEITH